MFYFHFFIFSEEIRDVLLSIPEKNRECQCLSLFAIISVGVGGQTSDQNDILLLVNKYMVYGVYHKNERVCDRHESIRQGNVNIWVLENSGTS